MDSSNFDQHSVDEQSQGGKKPATQKRKVNGDGSPAQPTRAKRNRYISIACNECKRRKIKCNGESPCNRCGNLSLECVYAPNCCSTGFKDSDEYRQMSQHLQTLQEQVDGLYTNLSALQQRLEMQRASSAVPLDPKIAYGSQGPPDARLRTQSTPQFSGPTNSTYDYDVANNSLQGMGMNQPTYGTDEAPSGHDAALTSNGSPEINNIPQQNVNPAKDPLLSLTLDEVLRLCEVYDEEVGSLVPMLDMNDIVKKAKTLYTFMDSMRRIGFLQKSIDQGESFSDDETLILKMILATASTIENQGQSDIGRALFENVRRITNLQDRLGSPTSIKYLQLLTITGKYYLHSNEEVQAYRVIGIAARACFEMGLHRSDVLSKTFTSKEELKWVVRLFWVIYYLDRYWSFGTGLPFAMQDADIDPHLPEPDDDAVYLKLTVAHGRISSKVWTSIAGFENINNEARKNEIGFIDYQIQQWQNSIPDALRYQHSDNFIENTNLSRRQRRQRLLLYLRTNQSRIQLYRPVLYSITSILENRGYAQTIVEIAKETIRTLCQVHQTSDVYQNPESSTHYYLTGALAVIFLAVSHAPLEFSQQVREEFYMALDLVKSYRTESYLSRRLWKTIKGLKDIVPKLGLLPGQGLDTNDSTSAAVAMAGLAGHQVDETTLFAQGQPASTVSGSPMTGHQMSNELTNLFEAAGGYPVMMARQDGMLVNGGMMGSPSGMPHMGVYSMSSGNEEEIVRIMKECF